MKDGDHRRTRQYIQSVRTSVWFVVNAPQRQVPFWMQICSSLVMKCRLYDSKRLWIRVLWQESIVNSGCCKQQPIQFCIDKHVHTWPPTMHVNIHLHTCAQVHTCTHMSYIMSIILNTSGKTGTKLMRAVLFSSRGRHNNILTDSVQSRCKQTAIYILVNNQAIQRTHRGVKQQIL